MHLLIHYNMGSKSAIGIGNGICFKQVRDKGGGSYIDPLVRDSIVGLWKSDQNTNESPTRNIIKNTIKGKGGDLELLNFGYKLNSGYGGYIEDFSLFTLSNRFEYSEISNTKVTITAVLDNSIGIYHSVTEENSALYWNTFKIKVSGSTDDVYISYTTAKKNIRLYNGINTVVVPNELSWHSFSASKANTSCNITLEFVPLYEGALVTDGKDDMIVSQKTVQEMLGGSNVCTVVSMIHQIGFISSRNYARNNYFIQGNDFLTNTISAIGKIGIYGYKGNLSNIAIVNDILGDKKDYSVDKANPANIDSVFSVNGTHSSAQLSQIAWYWTIIANKVLTTDQINQVISYFNLDKHVKPDIIYDTIRQGITNENHASFNDELVDFSGNGHNMKIYNSAWNKESGINDEGAWQTDGVSDYGNVENLPILKDYTVAIERRWITSPVDKNQCLAFKGHTNDWGAFACEFSNTGQLRSYTFSPTYNILQSYNEKSLVYQSKYSYSGTPIDAETTIDGSTLRLCLPRDGFPFYANVAIKMFLLFPYSLSEFLLERQLKRYKLGTLYPGMIEWRPKVNINVPVVTPPTFSMNNGSNIITNGQYIPEGTEITIRIFTTTDSSVGGINEATAKINGVDIELSPSGNKTYYGGKFIVSSKQKIDITIDEYIRYEDIVQPYPAIINLKQDGKTITWGDKLKVGSDIVFVESANLLPELYTVSDTRYNGVTLYPNTIIKVEKSMVFDNARTYLKANEPSCILSPNRLRIPNSSYKILGYIPDLTGKGNHGVINNSAYVGMSGANGYVYNWNTWRISKSGITRTITDNSLHITSLKGQYNPNQALFEPNTVANTGDKSNFKVNITGLTSDMKCTFNNAGSIMKELINGVNEISVDLVAGWYGFMITTLDGSVIGDCDITIQQIGQYEGSFCLDGVDDYITIPTLAHGGKQVLMKVNLQNYDRYLYDQRNSWSQYLAIVSAGKTIAYEYSNKGGKTYIDGILNEHIIDKDLLNITHNITATNANIGVQYAPNIGTSFARGNFAQMVLFDFMLFPEISSEEEIQELNDIVGIEGGYVERPEYYWDAYGKTNSDADRATIIDQVSKDPANALTANNFAFNEESGYVDNGLVSDGVDDRLKNTNMPVLTDYTWIMKRKRLNDKDNTTLCHKGNGSNTTAFLFEFIEGTIKTRSFGIDSTIVFPDLISWQTKNSYNGQTIASGTNVDGNVLHIFMGSNVYPYYTKAVFYKAMLYSKTIDMLSINMLKNLFEKDGLIDVNNPIFKKEEL